MVKMGSTGYPRAESQAHTRLCILGNRDCILTSSQSDHVLCEQQCPRMGTYRQMDFLVLSPSFTVSSSAIPTKEIDS